MGSIRMSVTTRSSGFFQLLGEDEGVLTTACHVHRVAGPEERTGHHLKDGGLVVNHQYDWRSQTLRPVGHERQHC
jgi:hypothetical protein